MASNKYNLNTWNSSILKTFGRHNELATPTSDTAGTTGASGLVPNTGLSMYEYYAAQSAGAPTNYGNIISFKGNTPGATQLLFPWGGESNYAPYIRTHSDWASQHKWSNWNRLVLTAASGTVGNTGQPVYVDAAGTVQPLDWHIGNRSTGEHNCNNMTYNMIGYYTSNGPAQAQGATTTDGSIYVQAYNSSWVTQLAQDYRNGNIFIRSLNNGTWQPWKRVLDTDSGVSRYHVGSMANNSYILVTINKETSWMLSFTLRLYQSYTATDIQISGYNYGSNHWYSPQSRIIASTTTAAIKVYFGYTGDYKLWVAVDGGSYNGAEVVDVCNGYTQIDYDNAFTVTKVNSLSGTTQTTQTIYRPWYRDETVTAATKLSVNAGNTDTPVYFSGGVPVATHNKLGAAWDGSYWGMRGAGNEDNWIRTTSNGIIPVQSGGAEGGHCYLGTSSWYFSQLYVDRVYCGAITMNQPAAHRNNGIIGTYDYTHAAAIWTMGSAYQIAADGTGLGNLYGAAYGYAGQSYIGGNTYAGGHQFLWCENGAVKAALGGSGVWGVQLASSGIITAGNYIYTSSYLQAANTVYINSGNVHMMYNGTWYPILRNYANGNTGVDAASDGLYLGYTSTTAIHFYTGSVQRGYVDASGVHNAVWNDFAEYRESDVTEPGRVVVSNGKGQMILATKRLQSTAHVISDTYGCSVGESDVAKTPLGVAGRVLVYPYRDRAEYKVGDCLCAAPGGTADIMTREEIVMFPDRIIGIVDEIPDYEKWEQTFTGQAADNTQIQKTKASISVNGRIWIYTR